MRSSIPLVLVIVLAGCGGGGAGQAVPNATVPSAGLTANAKTVAGFTITVPAVSAQAHSRNAQYISTATQSAIITLTSVNGTPFTGAQAETAANLSPGNSACSGSPLTCTLLVPAQAGTDVFTVSTYSAPQTGTSPMTPAGSLLSTATMSVAVVAGQTNAPATPLVLNGVASAITATMASDPHVTGTQTSGYALAGMQPYPMTITAQDASGATIVGDGAPTYTVSSVSSAVAVTPSTANIFNVKVKSFSTTPVTLTVTPSSGAATTVPITTVQELWVTEPNTPAISAFALTSPPTALAGDTITAINAPVGIAADANGILWITDDGNSVQAVAPGTNTPIAADTITGLTQSWGIAFDKNGMLWVADPARNAVYAYAPGSPPSLIGGDTISGLSGPIAIAFDDSNHVWISNQLVNIEAFAEGTSAPIAGDTIPVGGAYVGGLAFDAGGLLWAASADVNVYQPGTSTLINGKTITSANGPYGLSFDGTGHLWVADESSLQVTEYTPGTDSPIAANTISVAHNTQAIAIEP